MSAESSRYNRGGFIEAQPSTAKGLAVGGCQGSPCLNHLWFRVIDGALSLTAIFRSNDMFDAWCANAFGLRMLQKHVCDRVNQQTNYNLTLAPLMTLSQSAHIYDHSYEYADKVVRERYGKQPKWYDDPVGNFGVTLEGGEIVVSRMLSEGTVCKQYRGKNPIRVVGAIAQDAPAMQPDHALYLGTQLHRKSRDSLSIRGAVAPV